MKHNSIFALVYAVTLLASLCVFTGCAHWPPTPQQERVGAPGYPVTAINRRRAL